EEALVAVDLDIDAIRGIRRYNPIRTRDALQSEGVRATVVTLSREAPPSGLSPLPASPIAEPPGDVEEVYRALVLGTRDYVRKNGLRPGVMGLRGGVDSWLVACVAVDALGPEAVKGVLLPSRFTSEASRRYAHQLVAALGIELIELSIEEVVAAYNRVLAK